MKCPINEIQDDLTRNMAWKIYKGMTYDTISSLCDGLKPNCELDYAFMAAKLKYDIESMRA